MGYYDYESFEREFCGKKKKSGFGKRLAAGALVAAVGGGAIGFGFGSANLLLSRPPEAVGAFADADDADESVVEAAAAVEDETDSRIASLERSLEITQGAVDALLAEREASNYEAETVAAAPASVMSVSDVFGKASNGVVSIVNEAVRANSRGVPTDYITMGSGVVFSEDNDKIYIVTNYHVLKGATSSTISFDDKTYVPANYVGGDEPVDLAVISVKKTELGKAGITKWTIIKFADSDKTAIGDFVLAIGNAEGEGKSATFGIVSAVKKDVVFDSVAVDYLQTDAAINHGNSGGALVNTNGELVGINSWKFIDAEEGIEGMGFAITSNFTKAVVNQIMKTGAVEHPYLGVETDYFDEDGATRYGFPSKGSRVTAVVENSTAAVMKLQVDDIITSLNGKAINSESDLAAAFASLKIGDAITIVVQRPTVTGRGPSAVRTWSAVTLTGTVKNYPSGDLNF